MAVTQYIGSRYVPLFADPIEWSSQNTYEPLTIVLHEGNSYTSKQAVPKDIDISNEAFWAITGNYNAQIETYRRDTAAAQAAADNAQAAADNAQSAADNAQEDVDVLSSNVNELSQGLAAANENIQNAFDEIDAIDNKIESSNGIELTSTYIKDINCYVHCIKIPKNLVLIPSLAVKDVHYTYANEYAYNSANSFLINGSLGTPRLSNGIAYGENRGVGAQGWYIFGFDANGNPKYTPDINFEMTTNRMISEGYVTGFPVWSPIVINSVPYNYASEIPSSSSDYTYIFEQSHPRSVFGWDNDNYYLVAAEGRLPYSKGINFAQLVIMCNKLHIPNAVNMDGGGSTQLWVTSPANNLVYFRDVSVSDDNNVPYKTRNVQALINIERREV